ncbi:hypothetical protein [Olivibacter sitiensis]|uniref:hypothetical protein n=1 Tax=Olivibacter sitiensis TaxID=376470 RepID=UPI000429FECD|nr:hypothetical protein [Olivibacter sitiensis]
MKKLVFRFACFVSLFVALYLLSTIVIYYSPLQFLKTNIPNRKYKSAGFTARRLAEADTTRQVDVLILGSSLAYRNYDTRVFDSVGYKVFTLGTSSQKPSTTYILAKRYVNQMKPRLVILDVNPLLLLRDRPIDVVDILLNSSSSIYDLELIWRETSVMSINAFLLKSLGLTHSEIIEKKEQRNTINGDEYIKGGYVFTDTTNITNTFGLNKELIAQKPTNLQMRSLSCLIDYLETQNINFLLVQSPFNSSVLDFLHLDREKAIQMGENYFAHLGHYVDANNKLDFPKTSFRDVLHLNGKGAEQFSEFLLPIVKEQIGGE